MDRDSRGEDTLSAMVLENIKNRLIRAFRAAGEPKEVPPKSASAVRALSISRCYQANEELRRAQIDGALTWLRSELVSTLTDLLEFSPSCWFGAYQPTCFIYLWASVSTHSFVFLQLCSWRCARRTSSWLRRCWASTRRSRG